MIRIVVVGSLVAGFLVFVIVVSFTVGFGLVGTGLFSKMFPMTGINGMGHGLHSFESSRLILLTHNVLDMFSQPGVVMVMEDAVVPAGLDSKAIEVDIVLDNMLVFAHLEVINAIFCISCGIDGAKLNMEGLDEC